MVVAANVPLTTEFNAQSTLSQIHAYLIGALQHDVQSPGKMLLDACLYAVGPRGKMVRPALMLEACRAVGGNPDQILPAIAGTEYGHTASLIHDDLIDGDVIRRGQESVHRRFGPDYAILGGDYLIFQTYQCFTRCAALGVPAERVVRAIALLSETCMHMCEGQAVESELVGNCDATPELYLTVIRLKTASFLASSAQIGAVLGGGDEPAIEALGRYGEHLGMAFQVIDDLLPYTESAETIRKSTSSDLANRRVTLPIIYGVAGMTSAQREWVRGLFAQPRPDLTQQPRLTALLASTGALARAREDALDFARTARLHLESLPPSASRQQLAALVDLAVHRHS